MTDTEAPREAPVDELRRLAEAATPGPWAWRGYTNGAIELRTVGQGGQRLISAMRGDPCVVELDGGTIALTFGACRSCRAEWAKPRNAFVDRDKPCEKDENLGTIYSRDADAGFIRPLNHWAVPEVSYRNDVARIDQPDAAYIAAASPDRILALLDRLDVAERAVLRETGSGHATTGERTPEGEPS